MDDTLCEAFFGQPTQPLHRRYEALRAVFLEHRPILEVAQQYGYSYGSLRNLITQFRSQCQQGHLPPFSPPHHADAPTVRRLAPTPPRSHPRSPTSGSSA